MNKSFFCNVFLACAIVIGSLVVAPVASAEGLLEGWTGDVFFGYNKTSGNTDKGAGSLTAQAVKKFETSEFSLKGNASYSESNDKMDGQKWDGLAKYLYDFGKDRQWFQVYQLFIDHDYFSDIDYRITPSAGIGYYIARTEDWTWDVDTGLGYRITRHRVNTAADDEVVTAILHTFMKKKVLNNAFLSEDLTVYPGLEADSGVLVRSETALTNPLSEDLDLQVKYVVDYNSDPAADKKKTDKQVIVGIKYKF